MEMCGQAVSRSMCALSGRCEAGSRSRVSVHVAAVTRESVDCSATS